MTILDEIFAHKRIEVADRQRAVPLNQVRRAAEQAAPALDFVAALTVMRKPAPLTPPGARWPALIAEVKSASPSRGQLVKDFDPLALARMYVQNGAAAMSVLTDERFFHGHLDDLRQIAGLGLGLPLLRKDFVCDPYQVYEARAAGADAILLIAAMLELTQLRDLHALARELGMAALVEVHTREELDRVLVCGPALLGVNNRNLHDFSVALDTTLLLRPFVPQGVCLVAESGIHTPEDVARLAAAGVDAVLVGEALVTASNRVEKIRSLAGEL
jgi:indole-3-glycerol phosphate synthase